MNLGLGSGDDRDDVLANRTRLRASLPAEPAWLRQIHGAAVVDAATVSAPVDADASFATAPDVVCSVLVADCMPVLLADRAGTRVAVAHAGWRGLAAGVLEATVAAGGFEPAETLAWLGPAIGPDRFEVGDDVRDAFVEAAPTNADAVAAAFAPQPDGKWLADLPRLATLRLASCGVSRRDRERPLHGVRCAPLLFVSTRPASRVGWPQSSGSSPNAFVVVAGVAGPATRREARAGDARPRPRAIATALRRADEPQEQRERQHPVAEQRRQRADEPAAGRLDGGHADDHEHPTDRDEVHRVSSDARGAPRGLTLS